MYGDWRYLGDKFFDQKRYSTALECYIASGDLLSVAEKTKVLRDLKNRPKFNIYAAHLIKQSGKLEVEAYI